MSGDESGHSANDPFAGVKNDLTPHWRHRISPSLDSDRPICMLLKNGGEGMKTLSYFALLFTGFCLLNVTSGAQAQTKPKLTTWVVKTKPQKQSGCSRSGGVYLGPNQPWHHWGTCVKISDSYKIDAFYTLTRSRCNKGHWVYVGPNRAPTHGGYCAYLVSTKWALNARRTETKSCRSGEVYAGPNRADRHWGHCLSIVLKKDHRPSRMTDRQAVQISELKECRKKDKGYGALESKCVKLLRAAGEEPERFRKKPVNPKPVAKRETDFVRFGNWQGLKRESPCPQNRKNRIAKYLVNQTDKKIRVKVRYRKHTEEDSFKIYYRTKTLLGGEREFLSCIDHLNQHSQAVMNVWDANGNLLFSRR